MTHDSSDLASPVATELLTQIADLHSAGKALVELGDRIANQLIVSESARGRDAAIAWRNTSSSTLAETRLSYERALEAIRKLSN